MANAPLPESLRWICWDLHAALGTGLTLRQCGDAYTRRFGVREADLYHVLRALTYFEDAERDPAYPPGLDAVLWGRIKAFFRPEAPKLATDSEYGTGATRGDGPCPRESC